MKKEDFIVGKWYKIGKNNQYISRFSEFHGVNFCTDTIFRNEEGVWKKDTSSGAISENWQNAVLIPDEEIQKLLPNNHPDKLKKEPNMFKKGDYIVTLSLKSGFVTDCAKENYCFKQRINCPYIEPEIDSEGNPENGNSYLTFDKKSYLKDWRYATEPEIAEYERLGKPYDVTTLQTKSVESELDKWKRETKTLNLSLEALKDHIIYKWPYTAYIKLPGNSLKEKAELLYNSWYPKSDDGSLIGRYVKFINEGENKGKIYLLTSLIGKGVYTGTRLMDNRIDCYLPVDCFELLPENYSIKTFKFKIGDKVTVCESSEDVNGTGFLYDGDGYEKIQGVAGWSGKIISRITTEKGNYYNIEGLRSHEYISEECLFLSPKNYCLFTDDKPLPFEKYPLTQDECFIKPQIDAEVSKVNIKSKVPVTLKNTENEVKINVKTNCSIKLN